MQEEPPVVGTVGIAEVVPGAMNVIPGAVKLGVDIRSISKVARDSVVFLIKELIDVIAEKEVYLILLSLFQRTIQYLCIRLWLRRLKEPLHLYS